MDDSCAVCAERLEWVAYGLCGHKEVCSTCVARLRFILNDRSCCICKTPSPFVFVTKALGEYTRVIKDFSVFPIDATEGQLGEFWYHEDTRSYFDDVGHYKMIKAMCRLSCSICDRLGEEKGNDSIKRRGKFTNIDQLKGHLFHRHGTLLCNLCLEGRKVFICEQKLYTKAQLNQHIRTGDSEVDGSEIERGGFIGHPMCEFCRNPFYGDNELYLHMSTEHYNCHICQRQHPGQYDYYKNYEDLEIHFRHVHFLCENDECLAKKFVVFQSESEIKRHNALEHGGHMSRSKRNAALQIPTSFRYRRINEHDQQPGRVHGSHRPRSSNYQHSLDIGAILAASDSSHVTLDTSASTLLVSNYGELGEIDAAMGRFELLSINPNSEPSPSNLSSASQSSRSAILEESFFPPLPSATRRRKKQVPKPDLKGPWKNRVADHLHHHSRGTVLGSARTQARQDHKHTSSSASSNTRLKANAGMASSSARSATDLVCAASCSASSSRTSSRTSSANQSSSVANIDDPAYSSLLTYPTVCISERDDGTFPSSSHPLSSGADVCSANKTLVEKIRAGLGFDKDKFAAFKDFSSEYSHGIINTFEYVFYVEQFGLSHLLLLVAQLCPDAQKQRELIDIYNARFQSDCSLENVGNNSAGPTKSNGSNKGKGKCIDDASGSTECASADSVLNTVRKLCVDYNKVSGDMEMLPKNDNRAAKGKSSEVLVQERADLGSSALSSGNECHTNDGSTKKNLGGGKSKQRQKTSKFRKVRLGDDSGSALLNLRPSNSNSEHEGEKKTSTNPSNGLPVCGVWQRGAAQRLFL